MSESGHARTEAERLVREWDKHDGDRIVRNIVKDWEAALDEFRKLAKPRCENCADEPEPGWIETDNNGPIVPCPSCNPKTDREIEWERALAQRDMGRKLAKQESASHDD